MACAADADPRQLARHGTRSSTARQETGFAGEIRWDSSKPNGQPRRRLDTTRAQTELGWMPEDTGEQALADVLDGIRDAAGLPTPPLSPHTSGPARIRELATGIGKRP